MGARQILRNIFSGTVSASDHELIRTKNPPVNEMGETAAEMKLRRANRDRALKALGVHLAGKRWRQNILIIFW